MQVVDIRESQNGKDVVVLRPYFGISYSLTNAAPGMEIFRHFLFFLMILDSISSF
jgi:hypothetical protein